MMPGTRIDYRIRLTGVPMRWHTLRRIFEYRRRVIRELVQSGAL